MDDCPSTERGVKVNEKGCPLDDDNDGIPNYLDKEMNTKEGSLVDEHGVTLTDAMLEQIANDTIAMLHSDMKSLMKDKDAKVSQSVANNNNKPKTN